MAFYLCGLPPQNPEAQSNHEKNIRQIPIEGHSTKYFARTEHCEGHQNKENTRNHHSQEEPKEAWLLNALWGPRTEKGHWGRAQETGISDQCGFINCDKVTP